MNNEVSRYVVFMSMLQLASYKRMLQAEQQSKEHFREI